MIPLVDAILVITLLLNLSILGTSRITTIIRLTAVQGVLLGLLPLAVHTHGGVRLWLLTAVTLLIKGGLIPTMLLRAMRQVHIRREVEPLVGLAATMVLGALGAGLAMILARRLPLLSEHASTLFVPASLSTVLAGFLLMMTRIKAITQAAGYLVLENGVYIFGLLLLEAMPFLVEVGVLLDLFVCIFVMGIILNHINREFTTLDTRQLATLKEE